MEPVYELCHIDIQIYQICSAEGPRHFVKTCNLGSLMLVCPRMTLGTQEKKETERNLQIIIPEDRLVKNLRSSTNHQKSSKIKVPKNSASGPASTSSKKVASSWD